MVLCLHAVGIRERKLLNGMAVMILIRGMVLGMKTTMQMTKYVPSHGNQWKTNSWTS